MESVPEDSHHSTSLCIPLTTNYATVRNVVEIYNLDTSAKTFPDVHDETGDHVRVRETLEVGRKSTKEVSDRHEVVAKSLEIGITRP